MYLDKQIKKYFSIAKEYSLYSDFPKIHIGAIIVYKNKVVSYGYNTTKQHPLQAKYNKYRTIDGKPCDVCQMNNTLHAELMSIINLLRTFKDNLNKCSIFVYREYKNGSTALCKPCEGCEKALHDIGIKNIYYTTNNGWCYERVE